jgi:hypothetical protein
MLSHRTLAILALAGASPLVAITSCGSSAPAGYDYGDDGSVGSSGGSGSGGGGNDATLGDDGGSGSTSGGGGVDAGLVTYDGPPPNVDGGMLSCATPNGLPIKFNPVYSGYDGTHTYQVPIFVEGVDPSTITWGSTDPTMVALAPYVAGIMITTRKAGQVDIIARAGGKCGSTHLTITQFQPGDFDIGAARYHNGNPLNTLNIPMGAIPDSGIDSSMYDASSVCTAQMFQNLTNPFETPPAQCINCHGANSNGTIFGMTLFMDVQHTPEQTGGFSDDEFVNLFVNGVVPDGGYFSSAITPECLWSRWHQWKDIDSGAAQTGMLSYLRALAPQEQTGCFELFNMAMCADGG